MDYDIKRVDTGDIPALAELTRLVWGGTIAPPVDTMKGKFRTAPFGAENIGFVAYPRNAVGAPSGNTVPAAYYGVFPCAARFGADEVSCAQSGDTMTHPDHRGKGLFITLALQSYELARQSGIQFVFGFPSPPSYPGFAKKLDWKFPCSMIRFNRLVPTLPVGLIRRKLGRPSRSFGAFGRTVASQLFDVGEPVGAPWISNSDRPAGIVRDERFWNYKEADVLFARSGNVGLALKFDGDWSIGEIMGDPSPREMRGIIRRLDLLAALTGAIRIKSWYSPGSRLSRLLEPYGRLGQSLPFGYVNFSCAHDPATLDLSFVDYDTF